MPAFSDYRRNPFTNELEPVTITNERKIIPVSSPFWIRLNEVPLKEIPSSLKIRISDYITEAITSTSQATCKVAVGSQFAVNNVVTIDSEQVLVTNVSGNTLTVTRGYAGTTASTHSVSTYVFIENSMAEVAANPGVGQFWPDYSTSADGDLTWNTGLILFHSSAAGKKISIDYKGLGTLMDNRVFPAGIIVGWNYSIALIPYGWALCDGTNGTPDLRGVFILGAGGDYAVDVAGGETTHTLTIDETPQHNHAGNYYSDTSGSLVGYSASLWRTNGTGTAGTTQVAAQGGGLPHNNMPPYKAKAFIMKL